MSLFISACSFYVSSLSFMNVRTNEKFEMLLFVSMNVIIIKAYFYTQHLLVYILQACNVKDQNRLVLNVNLVDRKYRMLPCLTDDSYVG